MVLGKTRIFNYNYGVVGYFFLVVLTLSTIGIYSYMNSIAFNSWLSWGNAIIAIGIFSGYYASGAAFLNLVGESRLLKLAKGTGGVFSKAIGGFTSLMSSEKKIEEVEKEASLELQRAPTYKHTPEDIEYHKSQNYTPGQKTKLKRELGLARFKALHSSISESLNEDLKPGLVRLRVLITHIIDASKALRAHKGSFIRSKEKVLEALEEAIWMLAGKKALEHEWSAAIEEKKLIRYYDTALKKRVELLPFHNPVARGWRLGIFNIGTLVAITVAFFIVYGVQIAIPAGSLFDSGFSLWLGIPLVLLIVIVIKMFPRRWLYRWRNQGLGEGISSHKEAEEGLVSLALKDEFYALDLLKDLETAISHSGELSANGSFAPLGQEYFSLMQQEVKKTHAFAKKVLKREIVPAIKDLTDGLLAYRRELLGKKVKVNHFIAWTHLKKKFHISLKKLADLIINVETNENFSKAHAASEKLGTVCVGDLDELAKLFKHLEKTINMLIDNDGSKNMVKFKQSLQQQGVDHISHDWYDGNNRFGPKEEIDPATGAIVTDPSTGMPVMGPGQVSSRTGVEFNDDYVRETYDIQGLNQATSKHRKRSVRR